MPVRYVELVDRVTLPCWSTAVIALRQRPFRAVRPLQRGAARSTHGLVERA
jgi:hypothetical protein